MSAQGWPPNTFLIVFGIAFEGSVPLPLCLNPFLTSHVRVGA